jgi:hypothetical protein
MCFWTHEKKTFFSWLANTRSGGISQGRTFCVRRAAGGAKRRAFTDAGAEGTASSEADAHAEVLDDLLALRLRPDLQPG